MDLQKRISFKHTKILIGMFWNITTQQKVAAGIPTDFTLEVHIVDRLCGLVVGVPGYRSGGPG
jgi:hypothetical protein